MKWISAYHLFNVMMALNSIATPGAGPALALTPLLGLAAGLLTHCKKFLG